MGTDHSPGVIGITGTIGSGKSTVGRILHDLGVPVIDTDKLAHHLLTEDTPTRKAVLERFGKHVQAPDGAIDRQKLGDIVFGDPEARRDLEAIVHPAVIMNCRRAIKEQSGQPFVAVLVPLLFEAGLAKDYDQIWTVFTDESVLRERLKRRDKLSDEQITARLSAQWSQKRKTDLAHCVIDNSNTEKQTRQQVETLVKQQLASPMG